MTADEDTHIPSYYIKALVHTQLSTNNSTTRPQYGIYYVNAAKLSAVLTLRPTINCGWWYNNCLIVMTCYVNSYREGGGGGSRVGVSTLARCQQSYPDLFPQ